MLIYGMFLMISRFILLKRHGFDLPRSVISRHTCDHPWCINPAHIIKGSDADNARDKTERNRGRGRGKSLTEEAVFKIRSTIGQTRLLAQEFGVTRTAIRDARYGRTWSHL